MKKFFLIGLPADLAAIETILDSDGGMTEIRIRVPKGTPIFESTAGLPADISSGPVEFRALAMFRNYLEPCFVALTEGLFKHFWRGQPFNQGGPCE